MISVAELFDCRDYTAVKGFSSLLPVRRNNIFDVIFRNHHIVSVFERMFFARFGLCLKLSYEEKAL